VTPLRYVILRHENIDSPHFDLMFEMAPGGLLATWRSGVWPIESPTPLLRLGDHRRDYLTYEGALTGNRGRVRRIEAGTFVRETPSSGLIAVKLTADSVHHTIHLTLGPRGEPHWTVRPLQ
jgi:hypothetical protein